MGPSYMILNYTLKSIIVDLSEDEVCTAAKILMQMPNPSFDIVLPGRFVTSDFVQMQFGNWKYEPRPIEGKSC
jgi:hypothetical protein